MLVLNLTVVELYITVNSGVTWSYDDKIYLKNNLHFDNQLESNSIFLLIDSSH